jgi:hypothetical protein
MLDIAFASSYFAVDCFTVVVADAKAKADKSIRFGTRSGALFSKPQHALSTNAGRCWPAVEPRDAWAGRQTTEHYER